MGKQLTIFLLFCLALSTKAQVPDVNEPSDDTDLIEILVEDQDDSNFGYDTFLENRETLLASPLNLNRTDYDLLRQSGLFSEVQIREIIRHIELTGPMLSVYELQTLGVFTPDEIKAILPYISFNMDEAVNASSLFRQHTTGRYSLFLRSTQVLEEQRGYRTNDSTLSSPYLGNNQRLYTRFRYTFKNQISYGFTAEKDPGEPFGTEYHPLGFDYVSAHYFKRGNGFVKAVALGDYELRIGQGLILWSGFGLGKSIYPINVKRTGSTLAPYSSVDENRFFRGGGVSMGNDTWELTLFGSYNQVDANISALADSLDNGSSDDLVLEISSLQQTGLHRTENELADKNAIGFLSGGGQLAYRTNKLQIAAAGVYYKLDATLVEDKSPYELYDFSGNQLVNGSLSYSWFAGNALFYGETAMSDNGGIGTLNGLIVPLDRRVDIAIIQRYFDPGFQTFFSQTFSENTFPRNERALYAGLEITPTRPWKINGYVDVYSSPWLEFSTDAPSYGVDYLATIYYRPSREFETYIRLRSETTDRNAPPEIQGDTPHDFLIKERRTRIRWNLSHKLNREWTLRSRVEMSLFQELEQQQRGYLLYQDVVYKPWSSPVSLAARYTVFNTDSYDTRIFAYENDLLYAYSIANLNGRGQRYYLMLNYSPFSWLDSWIKLVQTNFTDREEIGTGNERIDGSKRTELRLQLRFKW